MRGVSLGACGIEKRTFLDGWCECVHMCHRTDVYNCSNSLHQLAIDSISPSLPLPQISASVHIACTIFRIFFNPPPPLHTSSSSLCNKNAPIHTFMAESIHGSVSSWCVLCACRLFLFAILYTYHL